MRQLIELAAESGLDPIVHVSSVAALWCQNVPVQQPPEVSGRPWGLSAGVGTAGAQVRVLPSSSCRKIADMTDLLTGDLIVDWEEHHAC
jgi:hypothetical protein